MASSSSAHDSLRYPKWTQLRSTFFMVAYMSELILCHHVNKGEEGKDLFLLIVK